MKKLFLFAFAMLTAMSMMGAKKAPKEEKALAKLQKSGGTAFHNGVPPREDFF